MESIMLSKLKKVYVVTKSEWCGPFPHLCDEVIDIDGSCSHEPSYRKTVVICKSGRELQWIMGIFNDENKAIEFSKKNHYHVHKWDVK